MPGKRREPEDGPTALDMLDPAPVPRHDLTGEDDPEDAPALGAAALEQAEPGAVELGVIADLADLPGIYAKGAIAMGALRLAREVDSCIVIGRDAAGHVREIRQCVSTLREMAPGERKGDQTDDLRARRETRMQATGG